MAKIFVIAGHGAGDSGAVGNGYKEAERVRALAKRIKALGGDSVKLGDVSRNYYKDNGISHLDISKEYQIIELHMDSGASSARGGHVIIKDGLKADKYDKALAKMLKRILPGRSSLIVKRSDLANPKRAAAKGYSYRLVEFGFITNAKDVAVFNNHLDDLAKGVLSAFNISTSGKKTSANKDNTSDKAFKVKVTAKELNVRKGASTNYSVYTTIKKGDVYTIVETKNGWGKLKSGVGWINLSYTVKV